MVLVLTDAERSAVVDAAARERRVRRWRRYQAILLVGDGKHPAEVAAGVGCGRASVYSWLAAWRTDGLAGLVEAAHPRRGDDAADRADDDPRHRAGVADALLYGRGAGRILTPHMPCSADLPPRSLAVDLVTSGFPIGGPSLRNAG